jgi:putative endonuclease
VNSVSAAWSKLAPDRKADAVGNNGQRYEREAEALLCGNGLSLLARNWSCRFGEIDLIMRDGSTLVFVEVRQRNSLRFGGSAASIGRDKRDRIERAIGLYLSRLPAMPACRVDAVLFDGSSQPQWLRNIFGS